MHTLRIQNTHGYSTAAMVTPTHLNITFIRTHLTFYRNVILINDRVRDGVFAESTDVEPDQMSGIDGS